MQREIVLCHPLRTAIGGFNGSLRDVPATTLGATAIRAVMERAGLAAGSIDGVVMGHVVQAGSGMNPARQASVQAGLDVSVPAMTVNRVCGSGAQAIVSAAQDILAGQGELVIAGGMENMDRAPYLASNGRWGYRMGHAQLYDSMLLDGRYVWQYSVRVGSLIKLTASRSTKRMRLSPSSWRVSLAWTKSVSTWKVGRWRMAIRSVRPVRSLLRVCCMRCSVKG